MLTLKEASAYIGIASRRFPVACAVTPVAMPDGKRLYDMRDLDNWIDGLKDGGDGSDDEILARL